MRLRDSGALSTDQARLHAPDNVLRLTCAADRTCVHCTHVQAVSGRDACWLALRFPGSAAGLGRRQAGPSPLLAEPSFIQCNRPVRAGAEPCRTIVDEWFPLCPMHT